MVICPVLVRFCHLLVHHNFDEFHGDAAARDEHSYCICGHVKNQVAGDHVLDLVAQFLSASAYIAVMGSNSSTTHFPLPAHSYSRAYAERKFNSIRYPFGTFFLDIEFIV